MSFSEIYIPDIWTSDFTESLLQIFLQQTTNFITSKLSSSTSSTGTKSKNTGAEDMGVAVEVECRFGRLNLDSFNNNFIPGISHDIFEAMSNYFFNKVVKPKNNVLWWQDSSTIDGGDLNGQGNGGGDHGSEGKRRLVTCVDTDYVDVLFDDNIRLTFRLHFADPKLTKIQEIRLVEAIEKRKIGDDKTFVVKNLPKKQVFDMRISVSSEENLSVYDKNVAEHIHYAKEIILNSYKISHLDRIFGGSNLMLSTSAKTDDLILCDVDYNDLELKIRGLLSEKDVIVNFARKHSNFVDVNLARQLQWGLLTPNTFPGLNGQANLILRNFNQSFYTINENVNSLVYLTNCAGRITVKDNKTGEDVTYAVAANQYVITCKFSLLIPVGSSFAFVSSSGNVPRNHDVVHFRRKRRRSFQVRPNLRLDLTKIQQSLNPVTLSEESASYEVEMESILNDDILKDAKLFNAVSSTINMIKDIANYIYGVKLEAPSLSGNIWQTAIQNDEKIRMLIENNILEDIPGETPRKRKISDSGDKSTPIINGAENAQAAAADFYNKLNRKDLDLRSSSVIYHLRCFNNFTKTLLIQNFTKAINASNNTGLVIVDIACGKGADFHKFRKSCRIKNYIGIDIARKSLEDAIMRLSQNKHQLHFPVHFIEADVGTLQIQKELISEDNQPTSILNAWSTTTNLWQKVAVEKTELSTISGRSDLISMQFALHYMFQSQQRAETFFAFVATLLKPGGMFFATTVECNQVIKQLVRTGHKGDAISLKDEHNNEICRFSFPEDIKKRLMLFETTKQEQNIVSEMRNFGLLYNFSLKDEIKVDKESKAVDAPEWLVPVHELYRVGRKFGLKLILYKGITSFVEEQLVDSEENRRLMYRMNVLNSENDLSQVEWEIAKLYCAVAFEKITEEEKLNTSLPKLLREMKSVIPQFDVLPAEFREQFIQAVKFDASTK